jgi:hypothetical protein
MKNPARKGALGWVCLGVVALGVGAWPYRDQLSAMATGRVNTQARMRQVLVAFKVDPNLASQAKAFNGSVQFGNDAVNVRLDEHTGQLVSASRSRRLFADNPYKPDGPYVVRSESQAKAVMAAFIREAGVEMESFNFENFLVQEGEESTQAASGYARKIYFARFVERRSDPRFDATANRSGSIMVDGQTGLILRFSSIILPPADPWELNISEARAKEIALDAWRGSGASFDSSQVRVDAKYVPTGSSKKVLPGDRLIPGYVLGASSGPDSWHCFAIIDGRTGKVMQNSCQIPNRMRGE